MLTRRTGMKALSLFVVFTFVLSLGAPIVHAADAAATGSAVASKMTNVATKGLGDMWFFWGEHIKKLKVAPTKEAAFTFFKGRGASQSQAMALANNAESAGHLTTKMGTAATATGNVFTRFFNKVKGLFGAKTVKPAANTTLKGFDNKPIKGGVDATVTKNPVDHVKSGASSLSNKVRSFFSRFRSGGKSAATAKAVPADATIMHTDAASTSGSAAANKSSFFGKVGSTIKSGVDKAVLGTRRAGWAVGGGVKTGALTIADKLDFNRYYKIPVTDTTAIKVRGQWKSVTKFTNKGWVTDTRTVKSKTPGSLGEQLGQIEAVASKPAPKGFFGKLFAKFKGKVSNITSKAKGEGWTTKQTKAEVQRLKIEGNLLEQARMLNDAQRAIKYRIDHLIGKANSLRKPIPEAEIAGLRKQYDAIETTKKGLQKKIAGIQDSPTKTVIKDAARWALYSVGITASVNLIKQVFSGEGIDIKKAFAFMVEPQFWGGTVGGFLGSTLLTTLAAGIMPPGVGIFFKILPGFLGAALGFEFGSSLFGGQMDLLGAIVQTLASAGGYTLALSMIGPGFPAILAAIAAGSLATMLLNKFRGGYASEAFELPPQPIVPKPSDAVVEAPDVEDVPAAVKGPGTPSSKSLAQLKADVSKYYQEYMNHLKARKLADAKIAYQNYSEAKKALEGAKTAEQ